MIFNCNMNKFFSLFLSSIFVWVQSHWVYFYCTIMNERKNIMKTCIMKITSLRLCRRVQNKLLLFSYSFVFFFFWFGFNVQYYLFRSLFFLAFLFCFSWFSVCHSLATNDRIFCYKYAKLETKQERRKETKKKINNQN